MLLRKLTSEVSFNSINNIETGSISNISSSAESTIVTLTDSSNNHKVSKITCSGEDYAVYRLYIDTELIETKRSGPNRSLEFKFDYPLLLEINQILDVKVEHFITGENLSFESTIYSIK